MIRGCGATAGYNVNVNVSYRNELLTLTHAHPPPTGSKVYLYDFFVAEKKMWDEKVSKLTLVLLAIFGIGFFSYFCYFFSFFFYLFFFFFFQQNKKKKHFCFSSIG